MRGILREVVSVGGRFSGGEFRGRVVREVEGVFRGEVRREGFDKTTRTYARVRDDVYMDVFGLFCRRVRESKDTLSRNFVRVAFVFSFLFIFFVFVVVSLTFISRSRFLSIFI